MVHLNQYYPLPLITEHLPDGINLRLVRRFTFIDPVYGAITVPEHRTTDLASTPRIAWVFFPPHGRYKFASVIHDELYRVQFFGHGFKAWRKADRVMWRAMKLAPLPVPLLDRCIIHGGLFIGGYFGYLRAGRRLRAGTTTL